jgi:hypothetical protein
MIERYLAFLDAAHDVPHSGRTLLAHLKGTHDLLADWGAPEHVRVAGLFHSIYGTSSFKHQTLSLDRRGELRELIGPEAENLAYLFCAARRPAAWVANGLLERPMLTDRFTGNVHKLTRQQLGELLWIEAANLTEQGANVPARGDAPEHAAVIDDMKDQLLIAFLKRLGGKIVMPVAEVDDTGNDLFAFRIDFETRNFHFELRKKS